MAKMQFPYILEFMGIKNEDKVLEKDVENANISHLSGEV